MRKKALIILIFLIGMPALALAQNLDEILFEEIVQTEDQNRTSDGKIIRGSYLTNQWYDNWCFGLAGGVQALVAPKNKGIVPTPVIQANITKWLTPAVAVRFTLQGFSLKEKRDKEFLWGHTQLINENGINMFRQSYSARAGIMFSVSNAFFGYKPSRIWNCNVYGEGGLLRLADSGKNFFQIARTEDTNWYSDREFIAGFGVQNNFRINNHFTATFDINDGGLRTSYHTTKNGVGLAQNIAITAGVNYTIHKWYWSRHSTAVAPVQAELKQAEEALQEVRREKEKLEVANNSLNTQTATLSNQNNILVQKIVVMQQAPQPNIGQDELERRMAAAGLVLYFDINSDKIATGELIRLENYVAQVNAQDPLHVFYITGSADAGTGTNAINTKLSRARGEQVKKVLANKLHVPASQIVLKPSIISRKHEDGRLDRCVLLENE